MGAGLILGNDGPVWVGVGPCYLADNDRPDDRGPSDECLVSRSSYQ